jgi:hypothetical protein
MTRKRGKEKFGPCAFCGKPGTTRDHVPPQGLFGSPLPSNLITVPACHACNKGADKDDEYMARFAMVNGAEHSADGVEVGQKVLRAIRKPNASAKRMELYRSMSPVQVHTPGGLYLGPSFTLRLDGERLKRIMTKIIKGMFWTLRKERLPDDYETYAHPVGAFPPDDARSATERNILPFRESTIGNGAFAYRWVVLEDVDRNISAWRFVFYGSIAFMGYTVRSGATEGTLMCLPDEQSVPEETHS